jgi:hypothetical protein
MARVQQAPHLLLSPLYSAFARSDHRPYSYTTNEFSVMVSSLLAGSSYAAAAAVVTLFSGP